jgi:hypothetical protein
LSSVLPFMKCRARREGTIGQLWPWTWSPNHVPARLPAIPSCAAPAIAALGRLEPDGRGALALPAQKHQGNQDVRPRMSTRDALPGYCQFPIEHMKSSGRRGRARGAGQSARGARCERAPARGAAESLRGGAPGHAVATKRSSRDFAALPFNPKRWCRGDRDTTFRTEKVLPRLRGTTFQAEKGASRGSRHYLSSRKGPPATSRHYLSNRKGCVADSPTGPFKPGRVIRDFAALPFTANGDRCDVSGRVL